MSKKYISIQVLAKLQNDVFNIRDRVDLKKNKDIKISLNELSGEISDYIKEDLNSTTNYKDLFFKLNLLIKELDTPYFKDLLSAVRLNIKKEKFKKKENNDILYVKNLNGYALKLLKKLKK